MADGTESVLSSIEEALLWEQHWEKSAMRSATVLPDIGEAGTETARQLCARTGMDGYTATLLVASVQASGELSPYQEIVRPARTREMFLGWQLAPGLRWVPVIIEVAEHGPCPEFVVVTFTELETLS